MMADDGGSPPVGDGERPPVGDKSGGFYCIPNKVLDTYASKIGPFGILVLNALARYANAKGQAWPSHQTIADTVGIGRSTAAKAIDRLIETGLITKQARSRADGGATSNMYTLTLPAHSTAIPPESTPPYHDRVGAMPPGKHEQDPIEQDPIEQNTGKGARVWPNGYCPAGTGSTPIEVYHEFVSVQEMTLNNFNTRRLHRDVTDLDRWRAALGEWVGHEYRFDNIGGMLDYYRQGKGTQGVPDNGIKTHQGRNTFGIAQAEPYDPTHGYEVTPEFIAGIRASQRAMAQAQRDIPMPDM